MEEAAASFEAPPNVDAEYEGAIDRYIVQMEGMAERMGDRQRHIDALQAETRAALQAVLSQLKVT